MTGSTERTGLGGLTDVFCFVIQENTDIAHSLKFKSNPQREVKNKHQNYSLSYMDRGVFMKRAKVDREQAQNLLCAGGAPPSGKTSRGCSNQQRDVPRI